MPTSTYDLEELHKLLKVHRNNLAILREQAARHGMDVPLNIVNSINYEEHKIAEILDSMDEIHKQKRSQQSSAPLWMYQPFAIFLGAAVVSLFLSIITPTTRNPDYLFLGGLIFAIIGFSLYLWGHH